ncbi:hypothetical protein [Pseudomonas syringae]|uniref:Phage-related protein n=1 Tax=Pseudomonas syringae pv. papulans TaxID=83963 RepID=A0AA43DWZ0_PSESX|nr:hypothetical protein [Pseudomonas syringae]KPY33117.1 hypothetical protein ALO65_200026 [Pseudomonas syringae pv. papulans]KWS33145.1 hypothetical protein AL059_12005 [Pseudomonas syringae pv. papulans]MDH4604625.1 hypothetical protein [Pseudomonas syringae pv. papulans]MDH4623827.1 hypothetical protein [Pseudomonas syringae pv. papulans]RMV50058.1 hypothetical protein ALP11_00265 [Pseudomonas syringae pv. papulans]
MSQVKERPILFSAPMVRAILSGQKTVTRRALKVQPRIDASGNFCVGGANYGQDIYGKPVTKHFVSSDCPYGQPGDRLWVRESWQADTQVNEVAPRELSHGEPIQYPADGASRQTGCSMITPGKTRPSIHMPRWVSRILLEITAVRVERLQAISEEQALDEGVMSCEQDIYPDRNGYEPLELFGGLWTMINGDGSWQSNPWVWVVEFKPVTA